MGRELGGIESASGFAATKGKWNETANSRVFVAM
jgi:hypothetical protein